MEQCGPSRNLLMEIPWQQNPRVACLGYRFESIDDLRLLLIGVLRENQYLNIAITVVSQHVCP